MNSSLKKQQGVTLLVGLIMLILLTLMAVTSYNMGKGNVQVVGNMQFRNASMRTAETYVESAISTPAGVSVGNDINPTPDNYHVTVTPSLVQAYVRKNNVININNPAEVGCTLGTKQEFGVAGASTGNSLCALALYNINVTAIDNISSAKVVIDQGVAVQVTADSVCSLVPC